MERKIENKAVVLFGPTAVGKTGLTENLFSSGYEIINADSIQVYRGLDILSAKPDDRLMGKIRHHLVNIKDPWEEYTSGDFCNDANRLIKEINDRGNIPLITGGTAYFFKMLLYKRSPTPKADDEVRNFVKELLEKNGRENLYSLLESVDSISASKIYKEDTYRITRALEVYYQTGRPLSSFTLSNTLRDDVDFVIIGLERKRDELNTRIMDRVEAMFSLGAIDEIRKLVSSGASPLWPAMSAIGYREWFDAMETGELSLRGVKEKIVKNSIKYAKRQETFFKSFCGVNWFNPEDEEKIKEFLLLRQGNIY